MNAINMEFLKPYRAISDSSDRTIIAGQIMWVSRNGDLNLPDKHGGGFLLKEEWTDNSTSDFEVEEAPDYSIVIRSGIESLMHSFIHPAESDDNCNIFSIGTQIHK